MGRVGEGGLVARVGHCPREGRCRAHAHMAGTRGGLSSERILLETRCGRKEQAVRQI